MKIPCKIIGDLLPLYADGVCSEESKKAVEEHLPNCRTCREELRLMRGDIESVPLQTEEEEPAKAAAAAWKRGQHKAFLKGGIITLVIAALVAAILCHCLIPIDISPKSFQTGDVFQHRVFRWNMPTFMVRLLCAKPMVDNPMNVHDSYYDRMLCAYRACTVNGQKGDMIFYFQDGLTILEILFNEKKDLDWSHQLLEELQEYYGPATEVLSNKGDVIYYQWNLGESRLQFSTGDFGKPNIYLFESTARK